MSVGSSPHLPVFLMYRTSNLKVLSRCLFEVDLKHLSISFGLFSSLTDLLIVSAKETSMPPLRWCWGGRAVGPRGRSTGSQGTGRWWMPVLEKLSRCAGGWHVGGLGRRRPGETGSRVRLRKRSDTLTQEKRQCRTGWLGWQISSTLRA